MPTHALHDLLQRIDNAARGAGRPSPRLLAVAKTRSATEVAELAARLHQAGRECLFGDNYVQESIARRAALERQAGLPPIEWHLVGHLQSNKAREAANAFGWVQTVDRPKIATALARHRDPDLEPLQVLLQVNIDDESGKHGCRPDELPGLARAVAAESRLRLRGLMAIPAPHDDPEAMRPAFRSCRGLFDALAADHPSVDTLSLGMSGDFEVAIEEGATLVRIGTALFGPRGE
jgi:PLP dependent protein